MRYAAPAVAGILLVLAPGCARPQHVNAAAADPSARPQRVSPAATDPSARPQRVSPATVDPSARASHPPRGFTDNDKPTDWIVGTVTAGGTGPCYRLVTDDGTPYALHSTAGIRLDKGARVRVQGTPAKIRIDCGPGQLLEVTTAEPLR